jgi:membrane-bound lytic murein transglycosylase D
MFRMNTSCLYAIIFAVFLTPGCSGTVEKKKIDGPTEQSVPQQDPQEDPESYSTSEELSKHQQVQIKEEKNLVADDDEVALGRGAVEQDTRRFLEHVQGPVVDVAHTNIMNFNLHYFPGMYEHWINFLSKTDLERFSRHMKNGERHFPVVRAVLEKYGVPIDLFFVGLIESGYHLGARSHASAVGPWQFIKGTARRYGLRVDRKVDERLNIVLATQAAAAYFRDLYNIFGSWELALCAYNAGEYGVIRAIKKGNTRSYVELVRRKLLPRETAYYVPKVAAAKELVMHPEKYGLPKFALDFNSTVTSEETQQLLAKNIPPLPLPEPTRHSISSVSAWSSASVSRRPSNLMAHKVKKGEGLISIAEKYDVEWHHIKMLNRLKKNAVNVGQRLRLPLELKRYVVRRGDNLKAIAEKFGTTIGRIVDHNSLKTRTIYPRQHLLVPIAFYK